MRSVKKPSNKIKAINKSFDALKAKGTNVEAPPLPPFIELEENSGFVGVFVEVRDITIEDNRTHEDKDIKVYVFTDLQGKEFAISSRAMLDRTFKTVLKTGKMEGNCLLIERTKDSEARKGTMGNYNITVLPGKLDKYSEYVPKVTN
jgi:hypothetical protein